MIWDVVNIWVLFCNSSCDPGCLSFPMVHMSHLARRVLLTMVCTGSWKSMSDPAGCSKWKWKALPRMLWKWRRLRTAASELDLHFELPWSFEQVRLTLPNWIGSTYTRPCTWEKTTNDEDDIEKWFRTTCNDLHSTQGYLLGDQNAWLSTLVECTGGSTGYRWSSRLQGGPPQVFGSPAKVLQERSTHVHDHIATVHKRWCCLEMDPLSDQSCQACLFLPIMRMYCWYSCDPFLNHEGLIWCDLFHCGMDIWWVFFTDHTLAHPLNRRGGVVARLSA